MKMENARLPGIFWNWKFIKNELGQEERELRLEGIIAAESWYDDEITPKYFRDDLFSGS